MSNIHIISVDRLAATWCEGFCSPCVMHQQLSELVGFGCACHTLSSLADQWRIHVKLIWGSSEDLQEGSLYHDLSPSCLLFLR